MLAIDEEAYTVREAGSSLEYGELGKKGPKIGILHNRCLILLQYKIIKFPEEITLK